MSNRVEYVIKATDQASATIANVAQQFDGINVVLARMRAIALGGGPIGVVTAIMATLGGAAFVAAKHLDETVEQLERLQSVTGISTDRLQTIQQVIREGGGDVESFSQALVKLNKALEEEDPLLRAIGVTSRDPFEAFMQLARAITASSDAKARDAVATKLLGKAGAEIIPDLENLVSKFDSTYNVLERTGRLIGEDTKGRARELGDQLDRLTHSWDGFAAAIQRSTVGPFADALDFFTAVLEQVTGIESMVDKLEQRAISRLEGKSAPEKIQHLLALIDNERSFGNPNDPVTRANISQYQALIDLIYARETASRASTRDPLQGAIAASSGKGGRAREDRLSDAEIARRMQWAAQGGPQELTWWEDAANRNKAYFTELANSMEYAQVTATKHADSVRRAEAATKAYNAALAASENAVVNNMHRTISTIVRGTYNISAIWEQLMTSLAQDIAESFLRAGVGIALNFISDFIPGGEVIERIGKKVAGGSSLAPAGGDTYYISTLNAKDLVQELVSPSGQLRQANDRIRDVAIAASM